MAILNGTRINRSQVIISELQFIDLGFVYYGDNDTISITVQLDPILGVYLTSSGKQYPFIAWDSLEAIRAHFKDIGFNVNYDSIK